MSYWALAQAHGDIDKGMFSSALFILEIIGENPNSYQLRSEKYLKVSCIAGEFFTSWATREALP